MSYCRVGDDSDFYVFGSGGDRLECYPRNTLPSIYTLTTDDTSEMIEHLETMSGLGYKVPEYALSRLRSDRMVAKLMAHFNPTDLTSQD